MVVTHTWRRQKLRRNLRETKNIHTYSPTPTQHKTTLNPLYPNQPLAGQGKENVKNWPKMTIGPLSSLGSSTIVNDLSQPQQPLN